MEKAGRGRYFEDFAVGKVLRHAVPRTVSGGDVALYTALYGGRFGVQSSDAFARAIGYERSPVDDLLVFHIVFARTVGDISLNAVANLGYGECRFRAPVFVGDTLAASTEIIGLKENSNARTGIVYVRSSGVNQRGEVVLEFVRWVMVQKRDPSVPAPKTVIPDLAPGVAPELLGEGCPVLDIANYDTTLAGSPDRWGDYGVGERIDHFDATTIEEAEHQMATRLYQNTARVHFDALAQKSSRFGRRLVYGGHIISIARALSFNGLANAFHLAAINAGSHVAPCFAGDTITAWSEVLERAELAGRGDIAVLRLRTIAAKDRSCEKFPGRRGDKGYDDGVVLDLDYWVALPR